MDARHTVRTMERDAKAAFAPFGEMINQSRVAMEKSLNAMRDETMELLGRLHDHNGAVLARCTDARDLSAVTEAQEKWFTDFGRDLYASSVRFHETARHILADSIASVSQSMRNGAQAVAEAGEHAADAVEETVEHASSALREAHEDIDDGEEPAHPV